MKLFLPLLFCVFAHLALAAAPPSESPRPMLVGASLPLSGEQAEIGDTIRAGLTVAVKEYNATRPATAPRLQLLLRDDGGNADKLRQQLRELAEEHKVAAFLGCFGERNCLAAEQVAASYKLPLLAPIAANSAVCRSGSVAFCLHASHDQEALALARQLKTLGEKDVALFVSNSLAGYRAAIEKRYADNGLSVKTYVFADSRNDFAQQLGEVVIPQKGARMATVLLLDGEQAALASEKLRSTNPLAMIAAFSSIAPYRWLQRVQKQAAGTLVSHSLPDPDINTLPLGKQYASALNKYAEQDLPADHDQLEAYLAGRVLGELLKAGQGSRETLLSALQGGWQGNIGGFTVDFSQGKHLGAERIYLGIVGRNGLFIY